MQEKIQIRNFVVFAKQEVLSYYLLLVFFIVFLSPSTGAFVRIVFVPLLVHYFHYFLNLLCLSFSFSVLFFLLAVFNFFGFIGVFLIMHILLYLRFFVLPISPPFFLTGAFYFLSPFFNSFFLLYWCFYTLNEYF